MHSAFNCETDEVDEGRDHQACASALVSVGRLSHAGPGSRQGDRLECWMLKWRGVFGFVFMVIKWMIDSELNTQF